MFPSHLCPGKSFDFPLFFFAAWRTKVVLLLEIHPFSVLLDSAVGSGLGTSDSVYVQSLP